MIGARRAILGFTLALCVSSGAGVAAQETAREAVPETAPAEPQPPAADAESDLRWELKALREEVTELKTRVDDAEAAALEAEADDAGPTPNMLRVYGFMDFGFDKFFMSEPEDDNFALLRPTNAGTFVFGNLNVYLDSRPVESFHAMVELRFTLAPHGEELTFGPPLGTSYERIDSLAFDFSSPSLQSQMRLGSIYIERAYSEYLFGPLLKVQWGLFLTPFGIWNLDHGSPTLISLALPTFIASQMVPTRLLGAHVYGSLLLDTFELGYAVHLSNGRTPLDFDLSEDKAVGLRLFVAHEFGRTRWVLGSSAYIGHYNDQMKRVTGSASGNVFDWVDTVDYSEQVLGFDAALDLGDFRARSEGVLRWVHYDDGLSERVFTPDASIAYLPNRLEWDVYGILAYRTPWRVEPYAHVEFINKSYVLPRFAGTSRATQTGTVTFIVSGGLNFELTSHTLLKVQVAWAKARDTVDDLIVVDVPVVYARVVSSF